MKHRILYAVITAFFILTAILISGPAKSGGMSDASKKSVSSDTIFEGILAVKENHGDIFVRSENNVNKRRLKVTNGTNITRNGKPATYDDLKIGDKVRLKHNSNHFVQELDATGK